MTERERYWKTMEFKKADHCPFWQDWYSPTGLERWYREGLPEDVHISEYFGFETTAGVPVNLGIVPGFKVETIEETEKYRIFRDGDGSIKKQFKEYSGFGMPQWLEYPIKNRRDWEEYKKRLNPDSPCRYPPERNWKEWKETMKKRDYPLGIGACSFYGWIRNWIGVENLSLIFFDDPGLIHEMMEYIADFTIKVLHRVLDEVNDIDYACFWEDMCYKTGPLISPKMFKDFMLPQYKKVTAFLRAHGVRLCWVDSDGNIEELIPLWIEGGVTGFYPLEVAAGMNAVKLRKIYGKNIVMWGNIDKRALAKGRDAIDEEINRLAGITKEGGFIPLVDHAIPEDVSFENYKYYIEKRKILCGLK